MTKISLMMKNFIRSVFLEMGYKVIKIGSFSDLEYEIIQPFATYSPWNTNKKFMSTYKKIEKNTLVDIYRCYELWELVDQIKNLDGCIIEIGVWRGGTGGLIAKNAELCCIPDDVYLCDTFSGVVKAGSKDSEYSGGEHADTSVKIVENLIYNELKLNNVKILKGIFPQESSYQLNDKKFRFCHIDVDVYQSGKDVIDWIWEKLVVGGIVVFDDYGFNGADGIRKFVDEQKICKDRLTFYNLNGHAIVIKLK